MAFLCSDAIFYFGRHIRIMEILPERQASIFQEEPSPELFDRFASAGRWLRVVGSIGIIAAAICLLGSILDNELVVSLLGITGSLFGGYFSLQLVLFGTKAIAARQHGSMAALSSSGRHLRNAAGALATIGVVALVCFIVFVAWLVFFGNFDRGSPD